MDHETDEKAERVGDGMALAALHLLAGVVAARPAALGGLDALAIDYARPLGLASRPSISRARTTSMLQIRTNRPSSRQTEK